jgi:hypothetical protein
VTVRQHAKTRHRSSAAAVGVSSRCSQSAPPSRCRITVSCGTPTKRQLTRGATDSDTVQAYDAGEMGRVAAALLFIRIDGDASRLKTMSYPPTWSSEAPAG